VAERLCLFPAAPSALAVTSVTPPSKTSPAARAGKPSGYRTSTGKRAWIIFASRMTAFSETARDAAWIARLRANEEQALREIMEAHFDDVAGLAWQYVRSPDVARDIAQEAFIRCWEQRHRLRADTSLRPYLFRVARNRGLDLLRQDARAASLERKMLAEYAAGTSQAVNEGVARLEADEFRLLIRKVAATLTPQVREILLLYFEQALAPIEIASMLQLAPSTVYTQLRKGLQVYARALTGRWP